MPPDTLSLYHLGTDEAKAINKAIEDFMRAAHAMGYQEARTDFFPSDLQRGRHKAMQNECIDKHLALNVAIIAALKKE